MTNALRAEATARRSRIFPTNTVSFQNGERLAATSCCVPWGRVFGDGISHAQEHTRVQSAAAQLRVRLDLHSPGAQTGTLLRGEDAGGGPGKEPIRHRLRPVCGLSSLYLDPHLRL